MAEIIGFTTLLWARKEATRWILGTSKARAGQCHPRVGSVFNKEYLGFNDLAKKSAKRLLEVAIDLVRRQRGGLKWLSTS